MLKNIKMVPVDEAGNQLPDIIVYSPLSDGKTFGLVKIDNISLVINDEGKLEIALKYDIDAIYDKLGTEVIRLDKRIDNLNIDNDEKVNDLESEITINTNDIIIVKNRVTKNEIDITTEKTRNDGQDISIASQNSRLTRLELNVPEFLGTVQTYTENITQAILTNAAIIFINSWPIDQRRVVRQGDSIRDLGNIGSPEGRGYIWLYTSGGTWINRGLANMMPATNTTDGSVKGSLAENKVKVVPTTEGFAELEVNTITQDKVKNLEANLATKQPLLVSAVNMKTVNFISLLGPGNIEALTGDMLTGGIGFDNKRIITQDAITNMILGRPFQLNLSGLPFQMGAPNVIKYLFGVEYKQLTKIMMNMNLAAASTGIPTYFSIEIPVKNNFGTITSFAPTNPIENYTATTLYNSTQDAVIGIEIQFTNLVNWTVFNSSNILTFQIPSTSGTGSSGNIISVNGKTGIVVLDANDIGLGKVANMTPTEILAGQTIKQISDSNNITAMGTYYYGHNFLFDNYDNSGETTRKQTRYALFHNYTSERVYNQTTGLWSAWVASDKTGIRRIDLLQTAGNNLDQTMSQDAITKIRDYLQQQISDNDITVISTTFDNIPDFIANGISGTNQIEQALFNNITNNDIVITSDGIANIYSANDGAKTNINAWHPFGIKIDLANYVTTQNLTTALSGKQDKLVSGTNIKTVNGNNILGSGDIQISGSSGNVKQTTIIDNETFYGPINLTMNINATYLVMFSGRLETFDGDGYSDIGGAMEFNAQMAISGMYSIVSGGMLYGMTPYQFATQLNLNSSGPLYAGEMDIYINVMTEIIGSGMPTSFVGTISIIKREVVS